MIIILIATEITRLGLDFELAIHFRLGNRYYYPFLLLVINFKYY